LAAGGPAVVEQCGKVVRQIKSASRVRSTGPQIGGAVKPLDWYYDFVSPFCYLQIEMLDQLGPGVRVNAIPIVFAAILKARGQLGPAEIPQKRVFTYRMVQWLAEREGIPLRFPPAHPFNPLRGLRLALAAGGGLDAARTIFRYLWREGRALDDPDGWRDLCDRVGVHDADARTADALVKDELRRNGERALALGVFGVPTFVVDGELFWGADATGLVADFVRDPARFSSGEYRRLAELPIGVERARS